MLSGDNGILKRATDSKEQTIIGKEKEQVELAYISAAVSNLGGNVSEQNLRDELDVMLGDTGKTDETSKKTKVTTNSNGTYNVHYNETNHDYNVKNGQVAKVNILEDGIYIGNVRMGGLYLSDWKNENYNDYINRINIAEQELSIFFQKCYNKEEANYENALNIANTYGVNKEIIDWAYNNEGDGVRNVMVSSLEVEPVGGWNPTADSMIPLSLKIRSEKYNFELELSLPIQETVTIDRDEESEGSEKFAFRRNVIQSRGNFLKLY